MGPAKWISVRVMVPSVTAQLHVFAGRTITPGWIFSPAVVLFLAFMLWVNFSPVPAFSVELERL